MEHCIVCELQTCKIILKSILRIISVECLEMKEIIELQ